MVNSRTHQYQKKLVSRMMSNNAHTVTRRSVPCYFCNDFLEERYLTEHIKHCGAVLEECPNKCGVYVPRRTMESHKCLCPVVKIKKVQKVEPDWKDKILSVLTLLRSAIDREENERKRLESTIANSMKFYQVKQDSMDALRLDLVHVSEDSNRNFAVFDQRINSLELTCDNMEQRTSMNFYQISEQLKLVQSELLTEQKKQDKIFDEWYNELKDLKTFLAKESILVSGKWTEQLQRIHDLKLELEMRCKSSQEMSSRQNTLIDKIHEIFQNVESNAEAVKRQEVKVEELEENVIESKKSIEELQLRVDDSMKHIEEIVRSLESEQLSSCLESESLSTNGRLLWRIDRYREKMSDAKENDTVLCSPAFLNKEYGYTLRMELFLNGKGQWRDRHIIGCLRVVEGKWDPLLDWPCILRATVVLRDQENPANDVRKMVKTVAREKHYADKPDKESGIYMFIPHTTLTRYSGFIKNNVMFFDIQVKDVQTTGSSTL
ncbi:TNF receptor-associated factor 5-like [Prorops nasuta]|uniref:TNF receptor-associated factor 5-like n=1 Tax=Prorops nasuta TaxID=863751 RepID=UPI0034CF2F0A